MVCVIFPLKDKTNGNRRSDVPRWGKMHKRIRTRLNVGTVLTPDGRSDTESEFHSVGATAGFLLALPKRNKRLVFFIGLDALPRGLVRNNTKNTRAHA